MDRMRSFIGASAIIMAAAIAVLLIATSLAPLERDARLLMATGDDRDAADEPLRLSALGGPLPTAAHGVVVGDSTYIVLRVDDATIEAARDAGWRLPPLTDDPRGGAIIAFDARSTLHGCSADLLRLDIEQPGLWLMDPCHQGLFNALDHGSAKPGTPNRGPLEAVRVELEGGPDPTIMVRRLG